MGDRCQICGINADSEEVQQQGILFHQFPAARPDTCKQLLDVIGNQRLQQLSLEEPRNWVVCSRHYRHTSCPGPLSRVLYQDAIRDRSVPRHESGRRPGTSATTAAATPNTSAAAASTITAVATTTTTTVAAYSSIVSTTTSTAITAAIGIAATTTTTTTTTAAASVSSTTTTTTTAITTAIVTATTVSSTSVVSSSTTAFPSTSGLLVNNTVCHDSTTPQGVEILEFRMPVSTAAEPLPGPSTSTCDVTWDPQAQCTPSKQRGALSLVKACTYRETTPRKRTLCKRIIIQKKMLLQLRTKCKMLRKSKKGSTEGQVDSLATSLENIFSRHGNFATLLPDLVMNISKLGRGRRWSFKVKAIALGLFKRSPSCYRLLQKFIHVPSRRTLTKILDSFPFPTGFGKAFFEQLRSRVRTMSSSQKVCSLMFDEVSLSAGLHYNVTLDQIDGYEDYGHLGRTDRFADHALVFMVRGLLSKWKQPVAYFFCKGTVPTEKLKVLIKDVIRALQKVGLQIVATVCDQGPTNSRAIRELCNETHTARPGPFFKVGGKEIVTIFDPPHLLKTTRNNLFRHGVFYEPGKKAEWKHLVQLFEIDSQKTFPLCHRLTKDHIEPKGYRAMRVKLAAQVFSRAVAAAIELHVTVGGSGKNTDHRPILEDDAIYLGEFCGIMDQLFDSFNGDTEFPEDGKILRCWVSKDSAHSKFWKKMKGKISKWDFGSSGNKVKEGWINDIRAVQMLWKKLSRDRGVQNLCVRNLNQDPLENLFGVIRQHGCQNTNPTCWQFVPALKTSIVNNLLSSSCEEGGNCMDDGGDLLCDLSLFLSGTGTQSPSMACSVQDIRWFSAEVDSVFNSAYKHCAGPSQVSSQGLILESGRESAAYVAGYLARKILRKYPCAACESSLTSPFPLPEHSFIQLKENTPEDPKLVLPSSSLTTHVSVATEMLLLKLEEMANETCLLQKLKAYIFSEHVWCEVGCAEHGTSVATDLVALMCLMWVCHFCERVNSVLRSQTDDGSALPQRFIHLPRR